MLEFHRPTREWLQVRCPCGIWSKEPVAAWKSRCKLNGFNYGCDNAGYHRVSEEQAAQLRRLIEHPGWN